MTNRNLEQRFLNQSSVVATTDKNLYEPEQQLVSAIVQAADDRKAADIVVLKVTDVSYLSDYFVIATGFSKTQVKAISDAIEDKLAKEFSKVPLRIEGKAESAWILQDYGDVIVHIFLPQEREFYNLEAFWGHAERVTISLDNSMRE
jgi:ribosome-associated protein